MRSKYRSAENEPEFLSDLARELVRLDVDVIIAAGGAAAAALGLTIPQAVLIRAEEVIR